jgi:mannose-1-phosphate guanylyltransferase
MSGYARWAAVLAGGDGTRLRPFMQRLAGDDRPKQFCRILSQSTLLGETIHRVAYTVQPASTVFVVARDHEPFYRKDLADVRASHIVAQPVSRGTTAAVALALMRIDHLACPEPIVGFFPADHSYEDARPLRQALEQAYTMATASPDRLVLVGAKATGPDTDYGWIQPGDVLVRDRMRGPKRLPIHGVRGFVEKPTADVAEALFLEGAWWNTFVVIGHIQAFMDILKATVPDIWNPIAEAGGTRLARDCRLLRSVYDSIGPSDFSRDVLAACTERLAVVGPLEAGWTDLGQPNRVLAAMANRGLPRPNLRRIAS